MVYKLYLLYMFNGLRLAVVVKKLQRILPANAETLLFELVEKKSMTVLGNTGKLFRLGENDLQAHKGELQILLALNEDRYFAICVLLQDNHKELPWFRRNVERLLRCGHPLRSLVADLRCSCVDGVYKICTCGVWPKAATKQLNQSASHVTLEPNNNPSRSQELE
jgi:hypothetical protein